MRYTAWRPVARHYGPKGTVDYSDHVVKNNTEVRVVLLYVELD